LPIAAKFRTLLNQKSVQRALGPVATYLARSQAHGVRRIFCDGGVWIHDTAGGYFAYPHPYVRLDLAHFDAVAKRNFFWGYTPRPGETVMDVGAGVGEETLTFSRAVGERGRVICVEAHPRTFRCLEKLIEYNHLRNVIAVHSAVTAPSCSRAVIDDSDEYLANRLNPDRGIPVPAATLDAIFEKLRLGHIDLLKMNIEGAERFAIQGMEQTLRHTRAVCVSCHDFLAGDDHLRTKGLVLEFLERRGFRVATRSEPGLPLYILDQVWGYRDEPIEKTAG
jgi:FkbM family methyltransferase